MPSIGDSLSGSQPLLWLFVAFREHPRSTRRRRLLRFFSLTFPDGRAGIGLLLLRAALGSTSVIKGGAYLLGQDNLTPGIFIVGSLAIASGISILLGFLTPIVSIIGMASSTLAFLWLPATPENLLDGVLSILFLACSFAAVVLLGPGAYSIDSKLFGRREIIIPPASRLSKL